MSDTNEHSERTALVTGATSGLGFEAAVHLAKAGYDRVIITGRSAEKAEAARAELAERTGKNIYEVLALDLNITSSVEKASVELRRAW